MLLIETALALAAVVIAIAVARPFGKWIDLFADPLTKFAERRGLSVVAIFVLAIAARLAVLPVLAVPAPAVHDEFSYLLMADTFAHGRLANPTPPMWVHFETFHENMVPTYVSKYFPAQGAFLAFGQVALGNPFWGVVLSTALMCAAICWMLQGWMPGGWPLLGGVLALIRLATFSYWNNSYWGGSVTALGGALAIGALPRIKSSTRITDSILMGIGIALMATSRPFESIFVLLPVAAALLAWAIRRSREQIAGIVKRVALPIGACLILTLGFMMFYCWRTTGNPLRTPYSVHEETYSLNSPFWFMPLRAAPAYDHELLRRAHESWQLDRYTYYLHHPFFTNSIRMLLNWLFYFGPALTIPLPFLLIAAPYGFNFRDFDADTKFFIAILISLFVGTTLSAYFMQHYWAPIVCVFYALSLKAMKYLCRSSTKGIQGKTVVALATAVCVLLIPIRAASSRLHLKLTEPALATWASLPDAFDERVEVLEALERGADKSLVLVRYSPRSDPNREWIFNSADIEHQKVIWARDMGPEKNQELIDYFKDRKVWLVEPDKTPIRLQEYSAQVTPVRQNIEHRSYP